MTINEWADSTEAYLLLATVLWFAGSLLYTILVFCSFIANLTVGIINQKIDIRWISATVKITILWTIFFILNFFLHK